jgi:hypothetical protein
MGRRQSTDVQNADTAAAEDPSAKATTAATAKDSLRLRRESMRPASTPPTTETRVIRQPIRARGGLAPGAILTGVLVSFGAMMIFNAIIAGVVFATARNVRGVTALQVGVGVAIALVVAQFLAYLWGGYTAGRMARGAGAINGFLVALLALVIAVGVAALARWLGATIRYDWSFRLSRLAVDQDLTLRMSVGVAVASLIAMFVGATAGGVRGVWWHQKLEGQRQTVARDEVAA